MDSVSDRALLAVAAGTGADRDRAPRLSATAGLRGGPVSNDSRSPSKVRAAGTSEDVAFLLAHERRADLIVAVGTHGNLREFLDKGRMGMSSHVPRSPARRRDPDGREGGVPDVSRRAKPRDIVLLVGAVLVTFGLMLAASPALRLFLLQTLDGIVGLDPVARVITWRYHVVSLVAVVLAFGLGILAGTSVINEGLVDESERITPMRSSSGMRRAPTRRSRSSSSSRCSRPSETTRCSVRKRS